MSTATHPQFNVPAWGLKAPAGLREGAMVARPVMEEMDTGHQCHPATTWFSASPTPPSLAAVPLQQEGGPWGREIME